MKNYGNDLIYDDANIEGEAIYIVDESQLT